MNNDTGIYAIISPSGKQYIGSAISIKRRWAKHRQDLRAGKHHSRHLQFAWSKYGEGSMSFAVLALCPITDLLAVEQSRINSIKPEYNICRVAGSTLGIKLTAEHRAKISMSGKGLKRSSETRRRISLANKGKRLSDETRAAMSGALKGKPAPNKGRPHSQETLEKISAALTGKAKDVPKSLSHREAISLAKGSSGTRGAYQCKKTDRWIAATSVNGKQTYLGRYDTAELAHAAVLSIESAPDPRAWLLDAAAQRSSKPSPKKGVPLSPEMRAKISASRKGKFLGEKNHFFGKTHSAESRAKISAKKSGANNSNARAIICVETGVQFPAVKSAEEWLKTQGGYPKAATSCIVLSCQTGCKRYGFHWRYADQ